MGPSPVDRCKTGSKRQPICDGNGTPFKVITTAANVNDVTQPLALVDGIPPVVGRPGQPRIATWRQGLRHRSELRKRGILPGVSRKGAPGIHGRGKIHLPSSRPSPSSTSSSASASDGNDAWTHSFCAGPWMPRSSGLTANRLPPSPS